MFGWRVQLQRPELTVHVEMLRNHAFYFFGKEPGLGGLPTGASGRVVCLLSGGIDSPVAAWRVMRRGCTASLVHFHAHPFLPATSQHKVREIATLLARYQLRLRLHLVAFGELQRQVVLAVPPALRVVVYRRLMLRIAEVIARREGARALATGDVIGQVASQTIENLSVIESVATIPVLRPLIAFDKDEISAEAERLGTFPISDHPRRGLLHAVHAQTSRHARPALRDRNGGNAAACHRNGAGGRGRCAGGGVRVPGRGVPGPLTLRTNDGSHSLSGPRTYCGMRGRPTGSRLARRGGLRGIRRRWPGRRRSSTRRTR